MIIREQLQLRTKAVNKYQISKIQTIRVLLGDVEYRRLFEELGVETLVSLGQITESKAARISVKTYVKEYQYYLEELQQNASYPLRTIGIDEESAFIEKQLADGRVCMLPQRPFIQIQEHTFMITSDGRVQSMCFGEESIRWGVQISYPALFYNSEMGQPQEVLKMSHFANTKIFLRLRRYLRHASIPVTLQLQQHALLRTTFRMGRDCKGWANRYLGLQKHLLEVKGL